MSPVHVTYFSDVLCIWAYVAQARVDEVRSVFGRDVALDYRFVSVFGDARGKLSAAWAGRGGFGGYARHVEAIAARFPHVGLSAAAWSEVQPASSLSPHLFLKAIALWEAQGRTPGADPAPLPRFEAVTWAFRRAFFAEGRDISDAAVQRVLAEPHGVPLPEIDRLIASGAAFAALAADYAAAEKAKIEGSPTFVLNDGRQKLYGNVGFKVIEANIRELLREPTPDQASWC